MSLPDVEKPYILTTDASGNGMGAILEQEEGETRKVIAYFSKSYTKAQKNYSTSEQELLSIVTAVENFHNYLYGTKIKFFTDHAPLTHLLTKKNPHSRMERWMLRLERYELEFFHKAGKDNVVADMLSRLPSAEDINENSADDYLDVIVAGVNKTTETPQESTVPDYQGILVVEGEDVSCKNSSVVGRDSEQLINEQDQDEDIRWIMNRIKD